MIKTETNSTFTAMSKFKGFTLIELLIVVAILGVLSAIAIPAYNNSVLRSGRAEAKNEVMRVASELERYFSSNNTYATSANPLIDDTAGTTLNTTNGLYLLSVAAGGTGIATSFVATATAQGAQTGDSCTTLTITNTGVRGATGDTVEECWTR